MDTCDVTVCIAHLPDRTEFLREAVASVIRQTLRPVAVHVLIDSEGNGCGPTKNRLVSSVRTEWLAWLDDDDWLFPDHLERLWAARDGADVIYPRGQIHFGDGRIVDWPVIEFSERVLRDHNYIPVTNLVRTSLLREVPFPDDAREANDWRWLLSVVDHGARFRHVPEVTWAWRQWGGNRRSFEGMSS